MKRVAVLRGGPSEEYDVSMLTGQAVLSVLGKMSYAVKDITITKKGEWLHNGFALNPNNALEAVDVVFIALHGQYGEDGQVQKLLERHNIPFVGSKSFSSAIAFNKELTKQVLTSHGVKMPKHRRVDSSKSVLSDEEIDELFSEFGDELFLKPLTSGSSIGARYVPNKELFRRVLPELLETYDSILIEEYIRGKEATVGILENFRNENIYILPAVEIVLPNGEPLFSNENKYSGKTQEIVPGRFSYHERSKMSEAAIVVHKAIDCRHYSRSDFIIRNGEVYFLEVNTLPGLTSESLFPKAAAAVGLDFSQLINHLVKNAAR